MSDVFWFNPPFNKSSWPELGLALLVNNNVNYNPGARGFLKRETQIVRDFLACLDTISQGDPVGRRILGIPYVSMNAQIRKFANSTNKKYEEVFEELRNGIKAILEGKAGVNGEGLVREFGAYLEACRDDYWRILLE